MLLSEIAYKYRTAQIITHNDLDGYGAGAALVNALNHLGFDMDEIEVSNTDYKNPLPINEIHKLILISDISISNSEAANKLAKYSTDPSNLIIWFDHHQTSIDMYKSHPELSNIPGIRNTSACGTVLSWIFLQLIKYHISKKSTLEDVFEYMADTNVEDVIKFKNIELYIKSGEGGKSDYRVPTMPFAIELTDDYDRFVLSHEESKNLMEAFNSDPSFTRDCKSDYFQSEYLSDYNDTTMRYVRFGEKSFIWKRIIALNQLKASGFIATLSDKNSCNSATAYAKELKDIRMICLNSTSRSSLLLGNCLGHSSEDAIRYNFGCIYSHNGEVFTVSIYCKHPEEYHDHKTIGKIYDASDICRLFGGGGHPGAAGFVTENLEFSDIKPLPITVKKQIDCEIQELIRKYVE